MATCDGPECEKTAVVKGKCPAHYAQLRAGKELVPLRGSRDRFAGVGLPESAAKVLRDGLAGRSEYDVAREALEAFAETMGWKRPGKGREAQASDVEAPSRPQPRKGKVAPK